MKRMTRIAAAMAFAAGPVVVAAGCTASGTKDDAPEAAGLAPESGAPLPVVDAGPTVDAADDVTPPTCTVDGWCVTDVPTRNLSFVEVQPTRRGALALAQYGSRVMMLEYDGKKWSFVYGRPAGRLYALSASPDGDFVAAIATTDVDSNFGSIVVRGTKVDGVWRWDEGVLPNEPLLRSLWVGSPSDVYAVDESTITLFRYSTGEDGGASWKVDFEADWIDNVSIYAIAGTGPDDVWVLGSLYGMCEVAMHRSSPMGSFERVVDCKPVFDVDGNLMGISAKDGVAFLGGYPAYASPVERGRISQLSYSSSESGTKLEGQVFTLQNGGGGTGKTVLMEGTAEFPSTIGATDVTSLLVLPDGRSWATVSSAFSGTTAMLTSPRLAAEGGRFEYARLGFFPWRLASVRAGAPDNLWAIGGPYAFHKTTNP